LLRRGRHRGQHRQRLRRRLRRRPDQSPGRRPPRRRSRRDLRMSERRASLAVENGLVMHGFAVGADGERAGDLVFNTAMTGYHEILTDPSYAGQTVVMTYPLIGNYGVAEEDAESAGAWPEAFVIKEMASLASNHRAQLSLSDWLVRHGVVAI